MTEFDHQTIIELLGAFSLDAVDDDERQLVEQHLEHCSRCATELAGYRAVIARIGNSGGDAPTELWESIAHDLERPDGTTDRPLPDLLVMEPQSGSARSDRPRQQGRRASRVVLAGLAAAALLVQVGHLNNKVNGLQSSLSTGSAGTAASDALSDPRAERLVLDAVRSRGPALAQVAILPTGTAYFVNRGLPRLPENRTYQLWGMVKGEAVSFSVLGPQPDAVPFHVATGTVVNDFAVTAERAGGVSVSHNTPVAATALPA
jgi:anti-sigma factor RsiW